MASATVLSDLEGVAAGGAGKSQAVKLAAARVRPGLVVFGDGATTVVWGGATSGKLTDLAEIVPAGAETGTPLTVSGEAALTGSTYLQAAGSALVPMAQSGDQLTFLVAGGVPLASPLVPDNAPQYAVVVDRAAKTAVLKPFTVDGGKLPAGYGVLGVPLAVVVTNSTTLNLMFYPLLIALQSVPKVALAPILLVWLGTGIESKLAIAWLVAFFPILSNTILGLRSVDANQIGRAHV